LRWTELEYSRTFNLGNYESERITLKAEFDETDDLTESYRNLKAAVLSLHEDGKLIDESRKAAQNQDLPYNPENIKWIRAEGQKGPYERYPAPAQKPQMTVDYTNLLADLRKHDGRMVRNGMYYWLFSNDVTIGRKPVTAKA